MHCYQRPTYIVTYLCIQGMYGGICLLFNAFLETKRLTKVITYLTTKIYSLNQSFSEHYTIFNNKINISQL